MPFTYGFKVRAFACDIQVEATQPDVYAVLKRYVFPSLPKYDRSEELADLLIQVSVVEDQFELRVNDMAVATAADPLLLVPDVIRALDEAVLQRLTTMRAVHAGVVQWGDRVLLLPGITHAGKSSLVAELLRRGATYFSDEYALIDAEGLVHPYPRPLLVRNGRPDQSPLLAGECNAPVGFAPAPVGWVLSVTYGSTSEWSITEIPQSIGLLALLGNTPHALSDSPELVDVFRRAIAGASCYVGKRNEAAHAADHIVRLIAA